MSDIPSSWKRSTIGEVSAYIQRGKSPKYIDHSDLPVINQKCIRWEELQLQHLKYIHPEQFSAWDESRFIKAGDILWNSTGTGTVGRAYHVKEADCTPPKVVDSHVTIVRAAQEMDSRYLFNWIKGPDVQGKIEEMCDGTTNQIELSRTAIAATAIPIAPRNEQTRIANQLDTLLTRIQSCNDRFDAIPALLKRFRQTVLDSALNGGFSVEMGSLSSRKSYPKVRLSEVAESRLGKMLDKQKNSGTPTPYIGNINVRWFSFDLESLQFISIEEREKAGLEIRDGDVFICEGGEPGRCAIWNMGPTKIVFQKALHRVRPVKERLLSQWLAYCIRQMTDTEQLKPLYTGTTIRHLTGASLSQVLLPLPNVEEQTAIIRRVEALFALADRIEARATAARAHAQRLSPLTLAKAFRGELVPQDRQDEPANVLLQRLVATKPAKVTASRGRARLKTQVLSPVPLVVQPNWAALPDAVWATPEEVDEHTVVAVLVAVLKTWGGPMPQSHARLAAVLCQQPRLMNTVLPADEAQQWRRLVGQAAEPLPTQVALLQPATNGPWRKALAGMRARGDLVKVGTGPQGTWAMGPGAAQIETSGWPEGRAGWVVAYLRAHGVEAILPLLEPLTLEFVHAKAA